MESGSIQFSEARRFMIEHACKIAEALNVAEPKQVHLDVFGWSRGAIWASDFTSRYDGAVYDCADFVTAKGAAFGTSKIKIHARFAGLIDPVDTFTFRNLDEFGNPVPSADVVAYAMAKHSDEWTLAATFAFRPKRSTVDPARGSTHVKNFPWNHQNIGWMWPASDVEQWLRDLASVAGVAFSK